MLNNHYCPPHIPPLIFSGKKIAGLFCATNIALPRWEDYYNILLYLWISLAYFPFLYWKEKTYLKMAYMNWHTTVLFTPNVSLMLFSHQVASNSFANPRTIARQAPLSMEFSRQEYWSGLPPPSPLSLMPLTKLRTKILLYFLVGVSVLILWVGRTWWFLAWNSED